MTKKFKPIVDVLESREVCNTVGPPFAPGIIKGHIEIETYPPGANLIEALMVAKDIAEMQGATPSRTPFILRPTK